MKRSAAKLLPERTTVLAITGATLGQVSLLELSAAANQSVVGVLGTQDLPSEFIYHWIRARIGDLINRQTGGAQQHVNKEDVNDLALLVPSPGVMCAYLSVVRPMFDRVKLTCDETTTLSKLRDALLPKLISGEIRVRDAERLVEQSL